MGYEGMFRKKDNDFVKDDWSWYWYVVVWVLVGLIDECICEFEIGYLV